jgi:hypothetical protein
VSVDDLINLLGSATNDYSKKLYVHSEAGKFPIM